MSPSCPFRRMVCSGDYTIVLLVLFGGWSGQAITLLSYLSFSADDGLHRPFVLFGRVSCLSYSADGLFHQMSGCEHHFMNNICSTAVSFRAWSSGLLHVLVFRVPRFKSQSKRARMRDGVPEADLQVGKAPYEEALQTSFPDTYLLLSTGFTHVSYRPLHILVQAFTHLSCLLVLFDGWSAQLFYWSSSADGLHISPTSPFRWMVYTGLTHLSCPFRRPFPRMVCRSHYISPTFRLRVCTGSAACSFRRMVCTGHYLPVLFGRWSAELSYLSFLANGLQRLSYLSVSASFSADGLHRAFHISYLSFSADGLHKSPTCPLRRMVCTALRLVLLGGWSARTTHLSYLSQSLTRLSTCLSFRLGG